MTSVKKKKIRVQWLRSVILAIQEAEMRRTMVLSQPEQIVHKTLSQKLNTKTGLVKLLKF
jgi:hypothetical protein